MTVSITNVIYTCVYGRNLFRRKPNPVHASDPSYRSVKPPKFPQSAIEAQQAGKALLRVTVDVKGQPSAVEIHASSGWASLDQAAIAAVQGWSFNPASREGKAVSADVLVPICFAIGEGEPDCHASENSLDGIWTKPPQS